MKRFIFVVFFLMALLLPLVAQAADGKGRSGRNRPVGCARLKGKAKQRCEAQAVARAAAEARRRAEAARRAELAQQDIENRMRAASSASIAKDDTKGENPKVREIALKALGERAGTVVVMEPKTGKILAIVNQDWAIRKAYIPCSTIKLVSASTGYEANVIAQEDEAEDINGVSKLDRALAKSKNEYFDQLGAKAGLEKFVQTAQKFGLKQKTGINAEGEIAGSLPLVKKTGSSRKRFNPYSYGDGTEVTPLQLAVVMSALVNGGKKVTPTIPKPGQSFTPQITQIDIPQETLDKITPGMQGATEFGTARSSGIDNFDGVGKTGTCSDSISRIGLFASSAPIGDPQYTVVVIIRGRKYLGKIKYTNGAVASRIAGRVYRELLNPIETTAKVSKELPAPAITPEK